MSHGVDCRRCNSQLKAIRGCVNEISAVMIEGYEVNRCPLVYVSSVEWIYIDAYNYFKNGILPNPGGWLEQPARFGVIMQIIDGLISTQNEDQVKRCQSKP